jgi:hypothetical protein
MTEKTEIEKLDPENTLVRVFRYPSAIITNASFNEDGYSNTITFYFDASYTNAYSGKNKRETRWCYYLPKLKDEIRRAIEEGIDVSLVIRRYAMPTPGQAEKDIHDFCEGIIFN